MVVEALLSLAMLLARAMVIFARPLGSDPDQAMYKLPGTVHIEAGTAACLVRRASASPAASGRILRPFWGHWTARQNGLSNRWFWRTALPRRKLILMTNGKRAVLMTPRLKPKG